MDDMGKFKDRLKDHLVGKIHNDPLVVAIRNMGCIPYERPKITPDSAEEMVKVLHNQSKNVAFFVSERPRNAMLKEIFDEWRQDRIRLEQYRFALMRGVGHGDVSGDNQGSCNNERPEEPF